MFSSTFFVVETHNSGEQYTSTSTHSSQSTYLRETDFTNLTHVGDYIRRPGNSKSDGRILVSELSIGSEM